VNLLGNGDGEYGDVSNWGNNGGGTLVAETTPVHGGSYSIADITRTGASNGPGQNIPSGAGKYNVSAYVMQNTDATFASGAMQFSLTCGAAKSTTYNVIGNYGVSLPKGAWVPISATIDTSTFMNCNPAVAGGVIAGSPFAYLNQTANESPTQWPDMYIDDMVVTVTDGHNLVGNPNFETGLTAPWSTSGGTAFISNTIAHGGTQSMGVTGRTANYVGPKWFLTDGAAQYNVSLWVLHTGSLPHTLALQPTYTCDGDAGANYPPAVGTVSNVAGSTTTAQTWTQMTAKITYPPAGARAGCKLTGTPAGNNAPAFYIQQQESGTCGTGLGQIECPDIYIDDVSITLAP